MTGERVFLSQSSNSVQDELRFKFSRLLATKNLGLTSNEKEALQANFELYAVKDQDILPRMYFPTVNDLIFLTQVFRLDRDVSLQIFTPTTPTRFSISCSRRNTTSLQIYPEIGLISLCIRTSRCSYSRYFVYCRCYPIQTTYMAITRP